MKLDNYLEFTSQKELDYIKRLASNVEGMSVNMVANKLQAGGAATLKDELLPFLEELGLKMTVTELGAEGEFLEVLSRFYQATADPFFQISDGDIKTFEYLSLKYIRPAQRACDVCLVEGLHPLALSEHRDFCKKIVWRYHGDFSNPNPKLHRALRGYIEDYDYGVFTLPSFFPKLNLESRSILPSIDPLDDKNKPLSEAEIDAVYAKYQIPRNKKIILQIGRFDAIKDPLGVLDVFEQLKKEEDATLVLAGYLLDDTPESSQILQECKDRALMIGDAYVRMLEKNDLEINALQRGADIIVQKSIKEAFGMAVTEALWKEKPVVVSAVGGLAFQVTDGANGLLCNSKQTCRNQIKKLLRTPSYGRELGRAGYRQVKDNMLVTRHIRDIFQYLNIMMGKI